MSAVCRSLAVVVAFFFTVLGGTPIPAAEYFVGKGGNDSQDGLSRENAFLTIARGVAALAPGDTLTIGPGEYAESVERSGLGDETAETTLRAEIPGTVLLRGDVPVARFEPVKGQRLVYAAPFDREPQAVLEGDTLRMLQPRPSLRQLEFAPGTFFYDKAARRLYLSTSDLRSPDAHRYTVSVSPRSGLLLKNPRRVVIDGLAATGYHRGQGMGNQFAIDQTWGIALSKPVQCIVRNVTAYLNAGGICLDQGRDSLIEHCTAYGNGSPFQVTGGNICRYRSEGGDTIRDCVSYRGRLFGMVLYPIITGPVAFQRNLDWGDFAHFKGRGMDRFASIEECVGVDGRNPGNIHQSLVFPFNNYRPTPEEAAASGNIVLRARDGLGEDQEFAAPVRHDYRLQATSRFRGKGPEGRDLGPFPYRPDMVYLRPDGDDGADGHSVGTAWKSLARALGGLEPGRTAYLAPGNYAAPGAISLRGTAEKPIRLASRTWEPVTVEGDVTFSGAAHLELDSIRFTGSVTVAEGSDIRFENCTFEGKSGGLTVRGTRNLRVEQALFRGAGPYAIALKASPGALLRGNLYGNRNGPALIVDDADSIRYADYNGFGDGSRTWAIGDGSGKPLAEVQPRFETHSQICDLSTPEDVLRPLAGALGKNLGPHQEVEGPKQVTVKGPIVHSVGETEVNLEWYTSIPSAVELAWGPTPACGNRKTIKADQWGSYSIVGLAPGQKVYFRIIRVFPNQDATLEELPAQVIEGEAQECTTLEKAPDPVTYHVSPKGDDAADGRTPETAWRTLTHAADAVRAGDTVLIGDGIYEETVRLRATGREDRPITFRAKPGERVVLDGSNRGLGEAFILSGKHYIHLDGLYFRNYGTGSTAFDFFGQQHGTIIVNASDHVSVTRCLSDGRGVGYNPPFLVSYQSLGLSLRNCVIAASYNGVLIYQSPEASVEHCLFLRNLIASIIIGNRDGQPVRIQNNIFTDNLPVKARAKLVHSVVPGRDDIRTNGFYLRTPANQREVFGLPSAEGLGKTADAFRELMRTTAPGGPEDHSLEGNPAFAGMLEFPVPEPKAGLIPYALDAFLQETAPTGRNPKPLDFPALFATNPEFVRLGIGLEPDAFTP